MSFGIQNLRKIYPNGHAALNDVSFSVSAGEIFGLLGVNGSGKTTCSTIFAGLHTATSGELIHDRRVVKDITKYKRFVGYCPQHPTLHDMLSVWDNIYSAGIYFGLETNEAKLATKEVVEMFELQHVLDKLPTMLSGGYKQRVMLARSIVHNPQLVILDEPTVGLDPEISHKLRKIILKLKEANKCVVLTTHYLDEADVLCDTICILDEGKILHKSTKEELKAGHEHKNLEQIFIQLTSKEQEKEEMC